MRQARALWLFASIALLCAVAALSILVGSRSLTGSAIGAALFAFDPRNDSHLVIWNLRIPRLVIAVLAGAALGASGAVMQAITRNPLAEPGLLGVNAGAAAAVILGVALGGISSIQHYVWLAFLGAGLAGIAVFGLAAQGGRGPDPLRLILAGAALSIILASLTGIVLLNAPSSVLDAFRNWAAGSVDGRDLQVGAILAVSVTCGVLICATIASNLNAVALGDEVGRALGVDLRRTLMLACLAVMLLAGSATAAAGPIGFVGLMAPHLARSIAGPDQRWVLSFSAVLAALLLLVADIIGRVIVAPSEVAAGIVTALIGGPFFLFLVRRTRIGRS
ncbi:iron chelate uptake ABC transporter family permease subunit [Rhizobium sp. CSW-27]|uniref:FecCD family ABC transporter permease n=1 Tax=Rhizobium sp. CSW-27 TaxID=2839985 RepID=UPI00338E2DC8